MKEELSQQKTQLKPTTTMAQGASECMMNTLVPFDF